MTAPIEQEDEEVEECSRRRGSGEIGVDIRGRFDVPGPVPDDTRRFAIATCPHCRGMGYVVTVEDQK